MLSMNMETRRALQLTSRFRVIVSMMVFLACLDITGCDTTETEEDDLRSTEDEEDLSSTEEEEDLRPAVESISEEEYVIYSQLIEKHFVPNALDPFGGHGELESRAEIVVSSNTVEYFKPFMSGEFLQAQESCLEDLKRRNQVSFSLEALKFKASLPVVTVSESVSPDGWSVFFEEHPHAQGILTVSRIGFNPAMNEAVLYFSNSHGSKAGAGYMALFEKVDDEWQEILVGEIWIS